MRIQQTDKILKDAKVARHNTPDGELEFSRWRSIPVRITGIIALVAAVGLVAYLTRETWT